MIKQLITTALFAFGGAGTVLVHHLDVEPLAFTHPVGTPTIAADRAPAIVPASVEVATHSITLAEVQITAVAPRRAPTPALSTARLEPCSEWRDVGVLVVDSAGAASGVRSVRALCDQSGDER